MNKYIDAIEFYEKEIDFFERSLAELRLILEAYKAERDFVYLEIPEDDEQDRNIPD